MVSKLFAGLGILSVCCANVVSCNAAIRIVQNYSKHPDCSGVLHVFTIDCGTGVVPATVIGHSEATPGSVANCKIAHPDSPDQCQAQVADVEDSCRNLPKVNPAPTSTGVMPEYPMPGSSGAPGLIPVPSPHP